jgi:hypothetical protein
VHPSGGGRSRAQSLEMKEDSWCESDRKMPDKDSVSLDLGWGGGCVTAAECAYSLD